ncbi:MAG: SIS domain-containing protein [Bacteroidota bacterium]|nr:SIS domain-containing protein [Bacteroidota bacterium]MDP4233169.1 SIS domain-containing protein [Bacteroidota bacterium]MDP4241686.1 SIS domain-containing protein [Bacteroidota bacterium]MDP4287344.1 SIS domain-containing protein [Bacteroidota bacterium]
MTFPEYLSYFNQSLSSLDSTEVARFIELLMDAYDHDRTVFVIGNGGSAANASHFANDLAKGTLYSKDQPKRLRALSLTDNVALMTAYGNDDGYHTIFEQQLRTLARPNDILIAISGSGNSPNIIHAIEWANANGMHTVGITGFGGGKLKQIAQSSVHVPLNDMCTSESVHSVIFHYVALELQKRLRAEQPA